MENQIVIGKIVAPHGVRGDIRILPLTDKPEQFLDLDYLLLPDGRKLTVKAARFHKRMVLVTTAEIKSMNESELLRGMEVALTLRTCRSWRKDAFMLPTSSACLFMTSRASKSAPLRTH